MPAGGELILTTRRDGAWIVLDVTDTGVGMTEEVRGRIFDAFFSTRPGGSGLGLPTTRKIVEAHGGTIQVQSEPGKGSQFTIRLAARARSVPGRALLRLRTDSPRTPSLQIKADGRLPSIDDASQGRWTSRSASWWLTTTSPTPRPWPRASSGSATTASWPPAAARGSGSSRSRSSTSSSPT